MRLDATIVPLGAERLIAVHASPVEAVPLLAPFETLRLGPEEWLCVDASVRAVEAAIGSRALVVEVSDSLAGWRVSGRDWPAVFARISPLDPAALAPNGATRTLMGGVQVILRMRSDGFDLRVDRSYAAWFEAWLKRP